MITLAIESSTSLGGIAVVENDGVIFAEQFGSGRRHSSDLFVVLERALAKATAIDQVAVGLGPGAYSGVRVAIAAAIGIGVARKCELVGIPSVAAFDAEEYFAVGDARRGGFYFTHVRGGECVHGPMLVDLPSLLGRLEHGLPIFSSTPMEGVPNLRIEFPEAGKLATSAQNGRGICARGQLEPIYLRDALVTQPSTW